jgi:thymidylate synthase
MKIIKARNVCQALPQTIGYLFDFGKEENSRAGRVLVSPTPMIIETLQPRERVLFSPLRDANPFFHIAEAIWMLGGKQDAKFLDRFVHDFSSRYAEKDGTLHDAYGYRWRFAFGFDQLKEVILKLKKNPLDRQCVIQMWDSRATRLNDLKGQWKSRPCNTNIFLRINENKLDLTVCCRSNDMLWGAHGANAVHFSVLQEYLAAALEIEVGTMYQLSNNAHIYLDAVKHMESKVELLFDDRYKNGISPPFPIFTEPEFVEEDIESFVDNLESNKLAFNDYANPWFSNTLCRMMIAHSLFKEKKYNEALEASANIKATDWRLACMEWIKRRIR